MSQPFDFFGKPRLGYRLNASWLAKSRGFPNLEKGEFVYFMEKHVEYEFEAFKDIFERFDEDGSLGDKGSNGPTETFK